MTIRQTSRTAGIAAQAPMGIINLVDKKVDKKMKKIILTLLAVLILLSIGAFFTYRAILSNSAYEAMNALAIPTLIDSREENHDIEITIRHGAHEFFSGTQSETMGFNGDYLGPAIRLYKGEDTRIRFMNEIEEATTVHGHGLHVSGKVDGGPQNGILPGTIWDITLPIRQEAGTSWYHPHFMGKTAEHVHAGLAGLYLIEDENSLALDLPKQYGVNDIPLIIQTRSFTDGKMNPYEADAAIMENGARGDTLIVNGTVGAYKSVPKGWVRLRLLNGSNARFYRFYFATNTPFYKIATEGGFLDAPLELSEITMAPGERNEIMIDLSETQGADLMAEFLPTDPEDDFTFGLLNAKQKLVELRTDAAIEATGTLPDKLNQIAFFNRDDATKTRSFLLEMDDIGGADQADFGNLFSINGHSMAMDHIGDAVNKGEVEIWNVTGDFMPHPFHIHGVSFQILTQNGAPPAAEDRGWKDTVIVGGDPTELIMRFDYEAREDYPYMYHCHILEHEDGGMMGQFTVK